MVLRPEYLAQKLMPYPVPTKDGLSSAPFMTLTHT
jgi:hypothetical protein